MEINFKFEWWKLIFIGLEMTLVIVVLLFGGIVPVIIGYLFVGFLICLITEFVHPRIWLTWAVELWKEDPYDKFIK